MDQLTGLRGLAALMVFVSHAANAGLLPSFLGHGLGQIGVMIFFVLSGFLMGRLYFASTPERMAVLGFAAARVGRVVPLYWAVLLVSVALGLVFPTFYYQINDVGLFGAAFAFVRGQYELWTVAVEVQFYVLFALIWMAKWKYVPAVPHATVVSVLLIGAWGVAIGGTFVLGRPLQLLPFFLPYFLTGMLIAVFFERISGANPRSLLTNIGGLVLFVMLLLTTPQGLYFIGIGGVPQSEDILRNTWLSPLCYATVAGFFLAVVARPICLEFLASRAFLFLGAISYGFYLIHRPILEAVNDTGLPGPAVLFAALAITIAVAFASFEYFEKPLGKLARQMVTRRRYNDRPSEA